MNWKILMISLLIVVYLWQMLLHYLSYTSDKNKTPDNVRDVYDAATYENWKKYHHEKTRVSFISTTASMLLALILYCTDAYAAFAGLFGADPYLQTIAVLLLSTVASLLMIPFSYLDEIRVETKYGFNKSNMKTFIGDQIKGFIIGLIFTCGLGCLYVLVMGLGDLAVVALAAGLILFVLLLSFLAPLLNRIFNKFTPLEEGELKEKLTALLSKNGYHVKSIKVMDASRRSTKSNAYFTGFGKSKEIVLFDTLVASMTPDEICAVFAHEMGHGLHKDIPKMQIRNALTMILMAALLVLTARAEAISQAFGFETVNYGLCILLMSEIEMALLSPLVDLFNSHFSRRDEYRADRQAAEEGYGDALIAALKKLSRENYADLSPSPLLVTLSYSHPTLSQRIAAIEGIEKK